ncbi:MAG: tRNA uridine-5-carboxymethylaminomethyl(34) synthesis GTPase MnmE [Syntrophales bacterium]
MLLRDTIAAISTPPGTGAIGIVRISGPASEEILKSLFRPEKKTEYFESHRLYYGDIVSPQTGAVLDEVLVSLMRSPHSYTGEDVVEIHCHGGPVILQAVLAESIRAGARPARPGEFTERAFLNNRMDLSQAEAVMDMIMAGTEMSLGLAISHLKGVLSRKIKNLRDAVIDLLALVEASIDFPEEDIDIPREELETGIKEIAGRIRELLSTYEEGRIYREGLNVVITGRANVGKSSLLNRLLGEERAIVTPIPGTTRDFIAEAINIKGIPVRLTDTAGIRRPEDFIEREGIKRVWERLSTADIVLMVFDGSEPLTPDDADIIEGNRGRKIVPVINKTDLPAGISDQSIRERFPGTEPVRISAKYGDGISELKDRIHGCFAQQSENRAVQEAMISNLRHKTALEKAQFILSRAEESIAAGFSLEFIAADLRDVWGVLGEIIGETAGEDVLERIFSTFCIGK